MYRLEAAYHEPLGALEDHQRCAREQEKQASDSPFLLILIHCLVHRGVHKPLDRLPRVR
jgi:hypothetical protein